MNYIVIIIALVILVLLAFLTKKILDLRRVVPPSEVHVVRQSNKTLLYGALDNQLGSRDASSGNTYYEWPTWLPVIGVKVTILPLAVFDVKLDDYRCNDNGKLPFSVDVQAFCRITNYRLAAASIANPHNLIKQIQGVLEGVTRPLFGKHDLETIMVSYTGYGEELTSLVNQALIGWGLSTTKNIEIMDIRDVDGEQVIKNIMQRKKSEVEKASRIAVAQNNQAAREAEIEAGKAIDMAEQERLETVGKRTAEVTATVDVEKEKAAQKKHDAAKITKEKLFAVTEVERTRQVEIEKKATILAAEAEKAKMSIESEGQLIQQKNQAEGIKVKGHAEAEAERCYQMASVDAQTALAKEIGENDGYQDYLVKTHQIAAAKSVGLKQAENLGNADIRIIAGAGDVSTGVGKAAGVFSPQGGFGFAGMLEALGGSEQGKTFLDSINAFLNKNSKNAKGISTTEIFEALNKSDEGRALLDSIGEYLNKINPGSTAPSNPA